jgi:hypothetical protein
MADPTLDQPDTVRACLAGVQRVLLSDAIAAWASAQADQARGVLREAGNAEEHFAAEHRAGP